MSKRDWKILVNDILHRIDLAETYVAGSEFEAISCDPLLTDGVIRSMEVIGESARQIPEDFRNHYPQIPWKEMVGLRNRVIHEYFDIDLEIVWNILQNEFPPLKEQLQQLLQDE